MNLPHNADEAKTWGEIASPEELSKWLAEAVIGLDYGGKAALWRTLLTRLVNGDTSIELAIKQWRPS